MSQVPETLIAADGAVKKKSIEKKNSEKKNIL